LTDRGVEADGGVAGSNRLPFLDAFIGTSPQQHGVFSIPIGVYFEAETGSYRISRVLEKYAEHFAKCGSHPILNTHVV
jgi:hypothetical protein